MANKSFTIKIGADTNDFLKGLKSADRQIAQTQRTANELQKGLKLEFNEKNFVQAQKQVQSALTQTEQKAQAIRQQLAYLEKSGAVDTTGYQKLQTELAKTETKATTLKQQLNEINSLKLTGVSQQFTNFGSSVTKVGNSLLGASAAAGGFFYTVKKGGDEIRETGDDIATAATQYDMSTEAIQRWNYVALQSDVSSETILKAAQKVQAAFGDQMTGATSNATKALETLGLNYANFDTNEEAFQATIQKLSAINDATEQAAYATDIFGERYASSLIPLLQQGETAISSYLTEFEKVGYLSDEQVQSLAKLDNELNTISASYEQAKYQLEYALLPMYEYFYQLLEEQVIPAIQKVAEWFDGLSESQQKTIIWIAAFVAALAPALIVIGKMSTGIGALIKMLAGLKTASIATAAGIASLVGAMALGVDLIVNWQQMSTLEKVLKSLAVAALVAAAAMTVFHASWSLGIAVGAIAAAVVAGIAAINAASNELGLGDVADSTTGADITSGTSDTTGTSSSDYTVPTSVNTSTSTTNTTTNVSYGDIIVNVTDSQATADEIAEAVVKEIAVTLQSQV